MMYLMFAVSERFLYFYFIFVSLLSLPFVFSSVHCAGAGNFLFPCPRFCPRLSSSIFLPQLRISSPTAITCLRPRRDYFPSSSFEVSVIASFPFIFTHFSAIR
jgi:hypothetical protein